MPQEELDLLQLASRCMTEPSTGTSQIVWRQLRHADALGGFLHNVPNRLHRHAISPCPPHVLPTLLTRRNSFPRSIAAAVIQSSSSVLTQSGTGTVRTWHPLPTRSTMA